jgi:hypothetical protein
MENADLTLAILQDIRAGIATLERRFDAFERRFDILERRFDILERRFDDLEARFDGLEARFERLEGEVAGMRKDMQAHVTRDEFRGAMVAMNIAMNERFEQVERRVTELDVRTATGHRALEDSIRALTAHLVHHGSLAARVGLCERDIVDIKRQMF